jgi:triacylglycerol lipase
MEKARLLHFAKIAQATYLNPDQSKKEFLDIGGYKIEKFFDVDGAQGYLISNKEERVLSFRGTEVTQKSDVIADLEAGKNLEKVGGKVHVGFKGELDKLWPDIEKSLKDDSRLLFVTGHSLGAAMATIAASRLIDRVDTLVTFGSPRVGDSNFISSTNQLKHYRVRNTNDAVTFVPPRFMGFRHHGTQVYINFYGQLRELSGWQLLKDQIRARAKALQKKQWFSNVFDHLTVNYIKKLETPEQQ